MTEAPKLSAGEQHAMRNLQKQKAHCSGHQRYAKCGVLGYHSKQSPQELLLIGSVLRREVAHMTDRRRLAWSNS